jgi:hypothetical protein
LPAEIALNLVAAWWAFEGAGMLADPARLRNVLSSPRAAANIKIAQMPSLLIGLYLFAVGMVGTPA